MIEIITAAVRTISCEQYWLTKELCSVLLKDFILAMLNIHP